MRINHSEDKLSNELDFFSPVQLCNLNATNNKYLHFYKMRDKIANPFPNFNGCTLEE